MSKRSQRRYLAASAFIVLCAATYGVLYATLSSGWEDAVVKWVRQNGGVANIRPGKPCRSCMRGAIATQNIPPAGIILRIPSQTLIRLFHFEHNAFAAEYAKALVYGMHRNVTFNQTYGPFIDSLLGSRRKDLVSPELWDKRHIGMLQTPVLETLVQHVWRSCYDAYYHDSPDGDQTFWLENQTQLPISSIVDFDTFRYVSALVGSRYFKVQFEEDKLSGNETYSHVIAPLLEWVNHADMAEGESMNAYLTVYENDMYLRAWRPIKAGEEVRMDYQPGIVHRNDHSLLAYGFIQKRKNPMLPSVDLPSFTMDEPFAFTPDNDGVFYGLGGSHTTPEELQRLKDLLNGTGSSLEEDIELLKGMSVLNDIREKLVVEFRIERKRAILRAIESIQRELSREANAIEQGSEEDDDDDYDDDHLEL